MAGTTTGDFDGDGHDEVLLRHEQTGEWRYYALADTGAEAHPLPLPTDDLYRFLGLGDFDGDGRDDILFQRRDDRAWLYYAVQAPDVSPRVALREGFGVTDDPTFDLRAIGDLDGDGRDDLVLRNTFTGEWIAYLMDGGSSELRRGLGATRNLEYAFAGIGDFNGDGRDDLLLRHVHLGTWISYEMGVGERGVLRRLRLTRNLAFAFRGIGDLNGDGRDDILLRNDGTGAWIHYEMNGARVVLRRNPDVSRDTTYGFAAIGNFDGDGVDSVLLRHATTGAWVEYDLSGSTALAGHYSGLVDDLAWSWVDVEAPNSDGLWTTEDGRIVLELRSDDVIAANLFDLDGRTVMFTPDGEGGYIRELHAVDWEELAGEPTSDGVEIHLPFGFAFGGRDWDAVTVIAKGALAFGGRFKDPYWDGGDRWASTREYAGAFAWTPIVAPLYKPRLEGMSDFPQVSVATEADRVVITWFVVEPLFFVHGAAPDAPAGFQAVLYTDGRIAFHYRDVYLGDGVVGLFTGEGVRKGNLLGGASDPIDAFQPGHLDLTQAAIYESHSGQGAILEFTTREPIPRPAAERDLYTFRMYFDVDAPYWDDAGFFEDVDFTWFIEVPWDHPSWSNGTLLPPGEANRIAVVMDLAEYGGVAGSVVASLIHWTVADDGSLTFMQHDTTEPETIELPNARPYTDLSTPGAGTAIAQSEPFHYRDVAAIGDLACRVVERFGDDFDYLTFHSEFRTDHQEHGTGFRRFGRNVGVSGNGDPYPDGAPACDAYRLKGHWEIPVWMKSRMATNASLGSDRRFDEGLLHFAHEFMHSWTAFLSYERNGGREPLFGGDACNCHWRPGLQAPAAFASRADEANAKSLMGGQLWQENDDGTFTALVDWDAYLGGGTSWLDLYAMGLADASEVPDTFVLLDLEQISAGSGTVTATKEVVTIDQIIAAEGPRVPSASNAQTVFNVGLVYVVEAGKMPDANLLALHGAFRDQTIEYWGRITGGRSEMTTLAPSRSDRPFPRRSDTQQRPDEPRASPRHEAKSTPQVLPPPQARCSSGTTQEPTWSKRSR